jgi:hypothetical protein
MAEGGSGVSPGVGSARPLDDERDDAIRDLHLARPGAVHVGRAARCGRRDPAHLEPPCPSGMITRRYIPAEVDGFAAFLWRHRRVVLPSAHHRRPPRSPTPARPTWNEPAHRPPLGARFRARSYTDPVPGAVAQLGERLAGSQKVRGSSPLGSTSKASASRAPFPLCGQERARSPPNVHSTVPKGGWSFSTERATISTAAHVRHR